MYVHPQVVRHWLVIGSVALGAVCTATLAVVAVVMARRPSALQLEERRRKRLATVGRIVDGSLINAEPAEETPQTIIYKYRIAGVTYECSQDVSALAPLVQNLRWTTRCRCATTATIRPTALWSRRPGTACGPISGTPPGPGRRHAQLSEQSQ